MREICLNMIVHLLYSFRSIPEKQSLKYTRILNSDAVHSKTSLYKSLNSYHERRIQNTVKHLRWDFLLKEGGRFVELGQSDKYFVKTPEKGPVQHLKYFLLDDLKTTF